MQRLAIILLTTITFLEPKELPAQESVNARPNIVFAIADDWGWPHAGAYGDPVVQTPTFDQIAAKGILFRNAFVSSPSCTPSRNAILTGQHFWRLGWGANLWSKLDPKHATFPLLLEDAGYFVGHYRKSWGPGKLDNWPRHPAGPRFKSPGEFLEKVPDGQPFCFWFGASDPHRGYKPGSGAASGMDLNDIKLFDHFPDAETIRSDVADYYWEVQRFDRELGQFLIQLEEKLGPDSNTLVIVTGDHGMPFPRCKANVYDSGARVPMAVYYPGVVKGPREITDLVSTTDIAPTLLQEAGVPVPPAMDGKSWSNLFRSAQVGRVEQERDHVFFGKERHVAAQEAPDSGGTPMRAIRTDDYLLIRNFTPDRWPAGTPYPEKAFKPGCWLADCDNGPTKTYLVENRNKDESHRRAYELAFGKRPEFELYQLANDPGQLNNLANEARYQSVLQELNKRLTSKLTETRDPRILGRGAEVFDATEYFGQGPKHPDWKKGRRQPAKPDKL